MMQALGKWLVVAALAATIGLHWAFLQAVAWTGMVVSYSQSAPLTEAVSKTFDGQHPCKLCKKIEQGRKAEKQSKQTFEGKRLELFSSSPTQFVFALPDYS